MIHVCFGLHDKDGRYSKFTGTAMLSMFENTNSKITVHILHDNTLTQNNRDKFSNLEKFYEQTIKFYNLEIICAEEIAHIKKLFAKYPNYTRFTIGAIYKLLIPQSLSEDIEKIIYLDSDIIVNLDISELWEIDLKDKPLAAVAENAFLKDGDPGDFEESLFNEGIRTVFPLCKDGFVSPEDYFNNGIMILNLKQFRENEQENISAGIKFLAENFKYQCFDQEIFNYCFSKNYLKLPAKYNVSVIENRSLGRMQFENRILHYIHEGLNADMTDIFNDIWFNYFTKTPWFTKDTITHLNESFKQILNQNQSSSKTFCIEMTAKISGRERAFFIPTQIIEPFKKVFFVREDEEIIPLENQESFNVLANSMRNSLGKKIFFIWFGDYSQLRVVLINAGFVEERDFINAAIFLQDENNLQIDTYKLVRDM